MAEIFEITYSYKGNPVQSCTVSADTFEEALYLANVSDIGTPLPVPFCEWDYSNPISITCIEGAYEGENLSNDEIKNYFLTKEDIVFALKNNIMSYEWTDEGATCYCADNYFWFGGRDIETADDLNVLSIDDVADKLYECLNEFITEFPDEYHLYMLTVKEYQNTYTRNILNIIDNGSDFDKMEIAKNSDNEDILSLLAKDPSVDVRKAVAANINTPADVLVHLSEDECWVRANVAINPNTSSDVLSRLVNDDYIHTVIGVAHNPNTPIESLSSLFNNVPNNDILICEALAANVATPPHILSKLASHNEYSVREKAAQNPHTPFDALESLAADVNSRVLNGVALNPVANAELLNIIENNKSTEPFVRISIANHRNTSPELLLKYAKSKNDALRETVASNPNLPADAFDILIKESKATKISFPEKD